MNQNNVRGKEDSKDVASRVSGEFHEKSPKSVEERDPSVKLNEIEESLEEKDHVEISGRDESAKFPEIDGKESELKIDIEAEKELKNNVLHEKLSKESYPENWVELRLMVDQLTGEFHAIGGDRAPGAGDQPYMGMEVLTKFFKRQMILKEESEKSSLPTLEHWVISLKNFHDTSTDTVAIEEHPASWLAKYGSKRTLVFAMRITEEYYRELIEVGYR